MPAGRATDPITALIVDDDIADRKLVRRLIARTRPNARIHEAPALDDALSIDLPKVDLLFLDYLFPKGTGIEMISDLSDRWPGIAIVMMTGHGDEQIAKAAILEGAVDYVPKRALSENATQRIIENAIRAARMRRKIEEQRTELSVFADTLVHDLRAPVRSIAFLSEQIEEEIDSGEMDEARKELRLMRKSAQQMTGLIDSLTDYIRLDRVSVRERIPVEVLVEMAVTALDRRIRESGAIIRTDLAPVVVDCIAPQIAQLLQNLIENAIKYRGPEAPVVTIAATQEAETVLFKVTDNGVGVPPEFQKTIFQAFKRIAGRDAQPGSGLGLATCAKIAARHNGTIWCTSAPGGGTDIRFRIESRAEETPGAQNLSRAG